MFDVVVDVVTDVDVVDVDVVLLEKLNKVLIVS